MNIFSKVWINIQEWFKRNTQTIVRFLCTLAAFGLVAAFVHTVGDWFVAALAWLFVDRVIALIKKWS